MSKFADSVPTQGGDLVDYPVGPDCKGLTKREYMATAILAGMAGKIADIADEDNAWPDDKPWVEKATELSDALIAQLNK